MFERNELRDSVLAIKGQLRLTDEASEELFMILECAYLTPSKSVLYPENADFSVELTTTKPGQQAWIVGKKVYDATFVFVILKTAKGNRAIVDTILASN